MQTLADQKISTASEGTAATLPTRLRSVDALRGFDMFWIIGADALVRGLHQLGQNNSFLAGLAYQLQHAPWEGFRFYDLIFPLFIFIVGVSLVFSLSRRIASEGKAAATWAIFRRAAILYFLGLIAFRGMSQGIDGLRLMGVLQRIALCYFFAGLAFTWLKPNSLIALCATLLVSYWAVMSFVPVPGIGAGNFAEGKNLANWIDEHYLPLFKWDGDHDPEGILSTLPAIASCLLGVFAGLLLQSPRPDLRKVQILCFAGLAALLLGWLWSFHFPVIKKIWTSSYVLVAGGWSAILLGVFYLIIDVWKCQRWATPFLWIGMNAITIYMVTRLVRMPEVAQRLVGGEIKIAFDLTLGNGAGDLLLALVALGLSLALLRFLYQRKIFLRV